MIIQKEIHFTASPDQVWELLTNPAMTKQYMFGCAAKSTWQVGAEIRWEANTEEGKPIVYVKGNILKIKAPKEIVMTMINPQMKIADAPENYIQLRYQLEATATGAIVYLTQGDFSCVADGKARYEESLKSWELVIPLMQALLK